MAQRGTNILYTCTLHYLHFIRLPSPSKMQTMPNGYRRAGPRPSTPCPSAGQCRPTAGHSVPSAGLRPALRAPVQASAGLRPALPCPVPAFGRHSRAQCRPVPAFGRHSRAQCRPCRPSAGHSRAQCRPSAGERVPVPSALLHCLHLGYLVTRATQPHNHPRLTRPAGARRVCSPS